MMNLSDNWDIYKATIGGCYSYNGKRIKVLEVKIFPSDETAKVVGINIDKNDEINIVLVEDFFKNAIAIECDNK